MRYTIESSHDLIDGYWGTVTSTTVSRKRVSFKKFQEYVLLKSGKSKDGKDRWYISVSTELSRSWFGLKNSHIMALDCDSNEDMYATGHILKQLGIGYCLVESSPDHYWFFTDKIGSFKECFKIANGMIGADCNYINLCRTQKCFYIRAFPRDGLIPELNRVTTQNKTVINWVNEYLALYNTDFMRQARTNITVAKALAAGKMAELAADPAFDI